jgi:hypothetical protein
MFKDFTGVLWLLKLGALVNLALLASTAGLTADPHVVIPAQVLFAVSAYRCLFPVRYKDQVVLHDSLASSVFLTRLLATFSEVAFIYQLSYVLRALDTDHVTWLDALSWLMVLQVVASQCCVWGAILTRRLALYYYEELGWAVIIVLNTVGSAVIYATVDGLGPRQVLLQLNLLFGLVYLPWQSIHLWTLYADARARSAPATPLPPVTGGLLALGLRESIVVRNRATDAAAWGGFVGLTWMVGYWATLIPLWVYWIVRVFAAG